MSNLPAQLEELLRRQLVLYREVLDLSRRQQDAIASKDTATLMAILADKQNRIQQIEPLERKAAPLKDEWAEAHEDWPENTREAIETVVGELRGVLGEIVELENAGKASLQESKDASGQKVQQMQKGKMMHKAYGVPRPRPQARYKDRQG